MFSDPFRPDSVPPGQSNVEIKPTDEDVVRALYEIETASTTPPRIDSPLVVVGDQPLGPSSSSWLRGAIAFGVLAILGVIFTQRWMGFPAKLRAKSNSGTQIAAEQLLGKLAVQQAGAADQVLQQSPTWTGKTNRTASADQAILTALNLPDMHAREAAIAAELALDGIPQSEAGFNTLKASLAEPSQRVWALWMIGALGNRGVDPVHTAKVLESYLDDPDVNVRASAVNGLSLVATNETVPMLLDRFRNDPSPVVQERAACGLAESGMYKYEQRMTAAAAMVGWLDDPLLAPQQRAWSFQGLRDISGQNYGTDSAAWRTWYENAPRTSSEPR
jgi:HEAT repeats